MLSWFHTTCGGWNYGVETGAGDGAHRPRTGDGTCMDALADRSGTSYSATLSPPRSPAPRVGLSPRLAQPRGTQKWLAIGGSEWRCDPLWGAASGGPGAVGGRCPPRRIVSVCG